MKVSLARLGNRCCSLCRVLTWGSRARRYHRELPEISPAAGTRAAAPAHRSTQRCQAPLSPSFLLSHHLKGLRPPRAGTTRKRGETQNAQESITKNPQKRQRGRQVPAGRELSEPREVRDARERPYEDGGASAAPLAHLQPGSRQPFRTVPLPPLRSPHAAAGRSAHARGVSPEGSHRPAPPPFWCSAPRGEGTRRRKREPGASPLPFPTHPAPRHRSGISSPPFRTARPRSPPGPETGGKDAAPHAAPLSTSGP